MARPAVTVQQTANSAVLWLPTLVRLPAYSLLTRINMFIDTGAVSTALHPRDWEKIVPLEQWEALPADVSLVGIGGARAYARQEVQLYVFDQDTGSWQQCRIDSILLGHRIQGESVSASTPSILGMNILRRCTLTYDGPSSRAELIIPAD